jgi:hypothetical protein
VQRRASNSGVVMVVGQKIALGRVHAGKTVTIDVTDTQLAIHCDDGVRTVRRATDQPVTRIKARRPRKVEPQTIASSGEGGQSRRPSADTRLRESGDGRSNGDS